MHFTKIKIDGFGKLSGEWQIASPGLTLVVDRNEAGKSTLANALLFGLYGIPDAKSQRELAQRARIYQPWNDSPFRIELDVRHREKRLRIQRDFGKKPRHPTILDLDTLRDVTREYYPGSHDETGKRLTGLSLNDALKTIFLSQTEVQLGSEPRTTLTEAIQRIADTSASESTTERALQVIQSTLRHYPFPTISSSAKIEYELTELDRAIEQKTREYQLLQAEYEAVAQQVQRLEEIDRRLPELEQLAFAVQRLRDRGEWEQINNRLQEDDDLRIKVASLKQRAAELSIYATVAVVYEEQIQKTFGAYENERKQFVEQTEPKVWALRKQVEVIREQLAEHGSTITIAPEPLTDFQRYRKEWNDAVASKSTADSALRTAENALTQLGIDPAVYSKMEEKWRQLSQQDEMLIYSMPQQISYYTDAKRMTHSELKAVEENLREVGETRDRQVRKGNRYLAIGGIITLVGVLLFVIQSNPILLVSGFASLGVAILFSALGLRSKKLALLRFNEETRRLEQKRNELSERLAPLEEAYKQFSTRIEEIGKILGIYGNKDLLQALQARHRGREAYQNWQSCNSLCENHEKAIEQTKRELLRIASELNAPLDPTTFSDSVLESRLTSWKEIARLQKEDREYSRQAIEWETLRATKAKDLEDLAQQLLNMAVAAGAPDALPLSERLDWLKQAFPLRRELDRLQRETIPQTEQRLLVDAERAKLETLATALQKKIGTFASESIPPEYLGKDAHAIVTEVNRERDALSQERYELLKRVEAIQSKWESAGKLQHRIEELQTARNQTTAFRDASKVAMDELSSISTTLHATWATALNEAASLRSMAFGGSISRIDFAPDLSFAVVLSDGRRLDEDQVAALSTGAREQLYLAVRLAIADYLGGSETLPVILDEPFAHCDDQRFVAGMALLQKAARERQIILFTCHEQRHDNWRRTQTEPVPVITLTD